jgi:hypothetical protein
MHLAASIVDLQKVGTPAARVLQKLSPLGLGDLQKHSLPHRRDLTATMRPPPGGRRWRSERSRRWRSRKS